MKRRHLLGAKLKGYVAAKKLNFKIKSYNEKALVDHRKESLRKKYERVCCLQSNRYSNYLK